MLVSGNAIQEPNMEGLRGPPRSHRRPGFGHRGVPSGPGWERRRPGWRILLDGFCGGMQRRMVQPNVATASRHVLDSGEHHGRPDALHSRRPLVLL